MKNIIIVLLIITLIGCNSKKQQHIKSKSINLHDTIIHLSKDRHLYFKKFSKEVGLYYDRYLIKSNGDTIASYPDVYSLPEFYLSPNKRFIVIDNLNHGYVDEIDSTFIPEHFLCDLIDLNDGKLIDTYQSNCGGEWNSKNQWIDGDEIIFDPKTDLD